VIVDSYVGRAHLIAIKHIFVELNVQASVTLVAAAASSDAHLLLNVGVFLEFDWRFMQHQHLFVLQLGFVAVDDSCSHRVLHNCFWLLTMVLLLKHDARRKAVWKVELKGYGVITRRQRTQCRVELPADSIVLKEFFAHFLFASVSSFFLFSIFFVGLSFFIVEARLLFAFNPNAKLLGAHRSITANVNLTKNFVARVVVRLVCLHKDIASFESCS